MVKTLTTLLLGGLLSTQLAAHEHAAPPAPRSDYAKVWQQKQENAPRLAIAASFDETGRLWLARVRGRQLHVSYSDDAGAHFSPEIAVNRENELISADGEARPQIAAIGQRVYVSWTQALPQPFAGHVRFAVSADGGQTFSEPITINDDQRPITHRFNAMLADRQGVTLAWIDKRDGSGNPDYRGAAIYTARSSDGGQTFAANQKLADHSCECCRLGIAADRDGVPVVFWRHIFGTNTRDFALARLDESPQRASEDGWQIDACPHHGGALHIDENGTRHLVWFTGAPDKPGLYYRWLSRDKAGPPQHFGQIEQQAGHPQVATQQGKVHLVWREYDGQHNQIRSQNSVDRKNRWSKPQTLAQTTGAADDPLLISRRQALWLIWNTADDGLQIRKITP